MNKYSLSHIVAFSVLCVLSACSTTNGVPEGDQLYTGLTHVKYTNYTPCDHATDMRKAVFIHLLFVFNAVGTGFNK